MPELARDVDAVVAWLTDRLSEELGIPARHIDRAASLKRWGLDSVVAVEISGDLGEELELELVASLLWDYATLQEVAEAVVRGDAIDPDAADAPSD